MKKFTLPFLFIAATVLFFCLSKPDGVSSAAELRHVRIADDGIILYTIDSSYDFQPLFTLPKTYYVEYTGRSNSKYYIVKYMDLKSGLNGADLFVLKGSLNVADAASVASPYPSVTVRNALGGAKLYSSPSASSPASATLPSSNSALTYYGTLEDADGAVWHYAAYNGICGYIEEAALVEPPTVPPHPNSAPPSTDPSGKSDPGGGDSAATLILIVGIILPAAVILLLMFRPLKRRAVRNKNAAYLQSRGYDGKNPKNNGYDDPNGYDDSNQRNDYDNQNEYNGSDQPHNYDGSNRRSRGYNSSDRQSRGYGGSANSAQNRRNLDQARGNSYYDRENNSPHDRENYRDGGNSPHSSRSNHENNSPHDRENYRDGGNYPHNRNGRENNPPHSGEPYERTRGGGEFYDDRNYNRRPESFGDGENDRSRRNPRRDDDGYYGKFRHDKY